MFRKSMMALAALAATSSTNNGAASVAAVRTPEVATRSHVPFLGWRSSMRRPTGTINAQFAAFVSEYRKEYVVEWLQETYPRIVARFNSARYQDALNEVQDAYGNWAFDGSASFFAQDYISQEAMAVATAVLQATRISMKEAANEAWTRDFLRREQHAADEAWTRDFLRREQHAADEAWTQAALRQERAAVQQQQANRDRAEQKRLRAAAAAEKRSLEAERKRAAAAAADQEEAAELELAVILSQIPAEVQAEVTRQEALNILQLRKSNNADEQQMAQVLLASYESRAKQLRAEAASWSWTAQQPEQEKESTGQWLRGALKRAWSCERMPSLKRAWSGLGHRFPSPFSLRGRMPSFGGLPSLMPWGDRHQQYTAEHLLEGPFDVPGDSNNCMFHSVGHALDEKLLGAEQAKANYARDRRSRWAPHLRNLAVSTCRDYYTQFLTQSIKTDTAMTANAKVMELDNVAAVVHERCTALETDSAEMADHQVAQLLSEYLCVKIGLFAADGTSAGQLARENPEFTPSYVWKESTANLPRLDIHHSGLHYNFYLHTAPDTTFIGTDVVETLHKFWPQ